MIVYAKRDNGRFKCALMEAEDWELYKEIRLAETAADKKDHDSLASEDEEYWVGNLEDTREANFCLFDCKDPKKIKPIGHFLIMLNTKPPCFTNSFILPEYREKKLSDLLYHACFIYAARDAKLVSIDIQIVDTNLPSMRSAVRNGFRDTGQRLNGTGPYKILRRGLEDYKRVLVPDRPQFEIF